MKEFNADSVRSGSVSALTVIRCVQTDEDYPVYMVWMPTRRRLQFRWRGPGVMPGIERRGLASELLLMFLEPPIGIPQAVIEGNRRHPA